ncbi:L-threonine 3-dehydrogenase [Actinomadura sp. RB68]|uniref:L-threonine 3-dehydrogenase n=1 Tax=Actinomadura macrotermitis TaxID=2585200 RepID=A0A7K0BWS7_9ACTN|nr:L-threonine 3-dehydrogenase [Actinomadura macrotermitis]
MIRYEQVPDPEPGPGQVLVQVAATSMNPSETALRAGMLRTVLPLTLPYRLGWDVSGTVVAVGDGVTSWSDGDRVIGRLDAGGAAASLVAAPAGSLAAAPASIPLPHAAAIPVAGLAAWQAVDGRVRAGQRVLVNGAGGGVGGFAVQLAKRAGATVIATASPRSAEAVAALGADEVVDHTAGPLPGGMDVVINLAPVSAEAAGGLAALVRPGGTAVSIATPIPGHEHFVARNDPGQLARLVALVDAGELAVHIAGTVPLAEMAETHRLSGAGLLRGKTILVPS